MRDMSGTWTMCFVALWLAAPIAMAEGTSVPFVPEGFGAKSIGGKGGKVLWVTSLADEGPGTLREALEVRGPRIVRFKVGGSIRLSRPLVVRENGRLTLDGASAASWGGVSVCEYGFEFEDCEDLIVTHIRQRRARIDNGADGGCFALVKCRRVLFDHCSGAWSTDENFGAFRITDVTFQWCISAEGLTKGGHPKGAHSMGMIVHRGHRITIHHCLFASNVSRNPRWKGNWGLPWGGSSPPPDLPDGLDENGRRIYALFDIRNNVFYNYVNGGYADFVPRTNFVGNTYRPGPSTSSNAAELTVTGYHKPYGYPKLFVQDNFGPHRKSAEADEWAIVRVSGKGGAEMRASAAFEAAPVQTQPAGEAFELVLKQAGPRPLDSVDRRIIAGVREGKGRAGSQGTYSDELRGAWHEIHLSHNFTCQYCGFDGRTFPNWFQLSVDQVVPTKSGASNAAENLVTCCRACKALVGGAQLKNGVSIKDALNQKRSLIRSRQKEYFEFWQRNVTPTHVR